MESDAFEQEVLRIARVRWPAAENDGQEMVLGRERDGVFVTEESVQLVECTRSREKAKALKDLEKLYELYRVYRERYSDKAIKCWFVTQHEPTADQRACKKAIKGAAPELFNIVSVAQFQSKLVDSLEYLGCRERHKFGSIFDPATGNTTTSVKYIDVGINCTGEPDPVTIQFIANSILAGRRYVVVGEYGIGKSMMLREVFRTLAKVHRKGNTTLFPLYLNLREHQGQQEPAEIIERHARLIGYPHPSQLVRAWKAGYVALLLDGFDEVSSLGLQGAWRRLREARMASMQGIRRLVLDSPPTVGIAVAGRENFFDSDQERKKAIGESSSWQEVRLDEFGEQQIKDLVSQFGVGIDIPEWVPSRPLLLATLFAKGLAPGAIEKLSELNDPSAGWNLLLDEVCNREARVEHGISGENVRSILEALATLARSKESGIGPLGTDDIVRIFQETCGYNPDDQALIVLQRLPGLGRDSSSQDGSRAFVDEDLADACRAGDFARFCREPFTAPEATRLVQARIAIGSIGIGLAAKQLGEMSFSAGNLAAVIKGMNKVALNGASTLDVVSLARRLDLSLDFPVIVSKLMVGAMEVDVRDVVSANLTFSECYFDELVIGPGVTPVQCPYFTGCLIQRIEGRVSEVDLPSGRFTDCVIENFGSGTTTTNVALDLNVPVGARVLLTVLKKLFVQSLGGRKENALYRGLDSEHQVRVKDVLALLLSSGLAHTSGRSGEPVWIPVRRCRNRVLNMLRSPSTSTDPVLVSARQIK